MNTSDRVNTHHHHHRVKSKIPISISISLHFLCRVCVCLLTKFSLVVRPREVSCWFCRPLFFSFLKNLMSDIVRPLEAACLASDVDTVECGDACVSKQTSSADQVLENKIVRKEVSLGHCQFSSVQFSSRWYICAWEGPYAVSRECPPMLPLKQVQCWSD